MSNRYTLHCASALPLKDFALAVLRGNVYVLPGRNTPEEPKAISASELAEAIRTDDYFDAHCGTETAAHVKEYHDIHHNDERSSMSDSARVEYSDNTGGEFYLLSMSVLDKQLISS